MKYNRIAEDKSQLEGFAKKVEDNGWASLGVVVLPFFTDMAYITWEEYKEMCGIDLDLIFHAVDLNDSGEGDPIWSLQFKPSFNKIIAISRGDQYSAVVPPICVSPTLSSGYGATLDNAFITLGFQDTAGDYAYYINIFANRTISAGEI